MIEIVGTIPEPIALGGVATQILLPPPNFKGILCKITEAEFEEVEVAGVEQNGLTVFYVGSDFPDTAEVEIGGITYTSAINLDDIRPGEFVFDPVAGSLRVRLY